MVICLQNVETGEQRAADPDEYTEHRTASSKQPHYISNVPGWEVVLLESDPSREFDARPAVGTIVEHKGPDGRWHPVEIVGFYCGLIVAIDLGSGTPMTLHFGEVRPVVDKEQRAVDDMLKFISLDDWTPEDVCRTLYRAGYRKP